MANEVTGGGGHVQDMIAKFGGGVKKTESETPKTEEQASRVASPPSAPIHAKNHQPGDGVSGTATKQVVSNRSLPAGSPPPVPSRQGQPPLQGRTSAEPSTRTSPIPLEQIKPGPPRLTAQGTKIPKRPPPSPPQFNSRGTKIPNRPPPAPPTDAKASGETPPAPPPQTTSANQTPPEIPTEPKPQKRDEGETPTKTTPPPAPPARTAKPPLQRTQARRFTPDELPGVRSQQGEKKEAVQAGIGASFLVGANRGNLAAASPDAAPAADVASTTTKFEDSEQKALNSQLSEFHSALKESSSEGEKKTYTAQSSRGKTSIAAGAVTSKARSQARAAKRAEKKFINAAKSDRGIASVEYMTSIVTVAVNGGMSEIELPDKGRVPISQLIDELESDPFVQEVAKHHPESKILERLSEVNVAVRQLPTEADKTRFSEISKLADNPLSDIDNAGELLSELKYLQANGLDTSLILIKLCKNVSFASALEESPELRSDFNKAVTKPFLSISRRDLESDKAKRAKLAAQLKVSDDAQEKRDLLGQINTLTEVINQREGFHEFLESKSDSLYFYEMFRDNDALHGNLIMAKDVFGKNVTKGEELLTKYKEKANSLVTQLPVTTEVESQLRGTILDITHRGNSDLALYGKREQALLVAGLFAKFKTELTRSENKKVPSSQISIQTQPDGSDMLKVGGSYKTITDSLIPTFIENAHRNVYLKLPVLNGLILKPPAGGSISSANQQANLDKLKDNLRQAGVPDNQIDDLAGKINQLVTDLAGNFVSKGTSADAWFQNMENLINLLRENNVIK